MSLSEFKAAEIKQSLLNGNSSREKEIDKLINSGFNKTDADAAVSDVIKSIRQELFQQKLHIEKRRENENVGYILSVMISIVGSVFEIKSLVWYIIAFFVAAFAGYYGNKEKPVAGIAGSLILFIIFPFAYNAYFSNRESFIRLEILIPLLIAIVPAYLTRFIILKLMYPCKD